jgi:hypothetical protein
MIFCKNRGEAEAAALQLNLDPEIKVFGSTFFQKGGNLFKVVPGCTAAAAGFSFFIPGKMKRGGKQRHHYYGT